MILFCDTSALVKLYVVEEGSDLLKEWLTAADAVVACRIAWAEAHAALSRLSLSAGHELIGEQGADHDVQ